MKTNELKVVFANATVTVWGKQKGQKLGTTSKDALKDSKIDGEVIFYGRVVKRNPLTAEYMVDADDQPILSMANLKCKLPLRVVRDFILGEITSTTNGCVKVGNHENAQVYKLTLTGSAIERCYSVIEITEELAEEYLSVRSIDGKLQYERDERGRLFRTTVLHAYACPGLLWSEEQAIANWHANHKTRTGLDATNAEIQERRNNALEYLKQLKASLKGDDKKVDE